jgi:hypothetical protein
VLIINIIYQEHGWSDRKENLDGSDPRFYTSDMSYNPLL